MSAPRTLYDKIFEDHIVDRQEDGTWSLCSSIQQVSMVQVV